jgi:hypothetical protein
MDSIGVSYIEKLESKSIWTKEGAAVDDCVFDRKAHCWKFVLSFSYLLELLDKWLHKTYTPQHMASTLCQHFTFTFAS